MLEGVARPIHRPSSVRSFPKSAEMAMLLPKVLTSLPVRTAIIRTAILSEPIRQHFFFDESYLVSQVLIH